MLFELDRRLCTFKNHAMKSSCKVTEARVVPHHNEIIRACQATEFVFQR